MTYRSGKGKFVPRSNPCAVAAVVNERNTQRQQASARERYMTARRASARANGYHGPLTRAELAAMTAGTGRAA